METGMLHLHNLLRWIILILLLVALVKAFTGWKQGRTFSNGDRSVWKFTLISAHINLLVGLYLLFLGRYGYLKVTLPEGESIMSDKFFRFFWVEHPLLNIVAIILITMAASKAKKAIPDLQKFKNSFWLFLVALLLLMVSIPWPFREIIGENRGWFPGM